MCRPLTLRLGPTRPRLRVDGRWIDDGPVCGVGREPLGGAGPRLQRVGVKCSTEGDGTDPTGRVSIEERRSELHLRGGRGHLRSGVGLQEVSLEGRRSLD